jgi:WhiB family transcriptional regulator, redox-sensing transcriptional regulator
MADFSRLPGPNADLWDWQLRGLCRGKDSSLFFHPEGERGAARNSREVAAKEICMNCPVQISCAEHALKVREPYGVWGGMTEEDREEYHMRQKALVRAQAAREKAARLQQEKLKEKLLRQKAAEHKIRSVQAGIDPDPAMAAGAAPRRSAAAVLAAPSSAENREAVATRTRPGPGEKAADSRRDTTRPRTTKNAARV